MTYFSQVAMLSAALLLAVSSAFGIPTVSVDVDPVTSGVQDSLDVTVGDIFSVDVLIAGVDASTPVNGFQFNLGFDPTVLTAVSGVDGGFLLEPVYTVPPVIDNAVGDISFLSVTLAPVGAVGDGVLATVGFQAAARGVSVLNLNNVLLSAPFGLPIAVGSVSDGRIAVMPGGVVSEPQSFVFLALGLAALARYRRMAGVKEALDL